MLPYLLLTLTASVALAQGPPYPWTVTPLSVVGNAQTFHVHLTPPPAGVPVYYQVYLRIASRSGNPFEPWNSCNIVFNASTNSFFMESDGVPGEYTPAWVTRNGGPIFGGEPYTFPGSASPTNSQCVFHGTGSSAIQHSDGSVDADIRLTFKTPEFNSQLWTSPQYASSPSVRWVWLTGYNGYWWGWDLKGTINLQANDTMPPQITSVAPSPTSGTAVITWSTDEAATSEVAYGPTPALGSTSMSAGPDLAHGAALTNIQTGVQYYFRLQSRDMAGNASYFNGSFVAEGPPQPYRALISRPERAANYPLPADPGPCAVTIVKDTFNPQKGKYDTEYITKYVHLAYRGTASRPANNIARLYARNILATPDPKQEHRKAWVPYVLFGTRVNSLEPVIETWYTQQNAEGTAAVEVNKDINANATIANDVGTYAVTSLGGARSPTCETAYPNWFPAGQVLWAEEGATATQTIEIRRPEIPRYYAAFPDPPFYLGLNNDGTLVQTVGRYRSFSSIGPGEGYGVAGPPTWSIVAGHQYGRLGCLDNENSTQCEVAKFQALRGSSGCLTYDVVLKASWGGLDSKQMHIFINRPYSTAAYTSGAFAAWPLHSSVEDPATGDTVSWLTQLAYEARGLCATDPRMFDYSINESFEWSQHVREDASENWSGGWFALVRTGGSAVAETFVDRVSWGTIGCPGLVCAPTLIPPAPSGFPASGAAVFSVPQFIAFAPPKPYADMTRDPSGVLIQSHRLRLLQGGGAHVDVVNPGLPQ